MNEAIQADTAHLTYPPDAEEKPVPAIVVLHDHFGVDEFTLESARRLNAAGYATLVPNLFARSGGPDDIESATALLNFTDSLYDTQLTADANAAVAWLAEQDGVDRERLGVLGWGWGGAYALMAAAQDARIRAAVNVAGALTYPTFTEQHPGSPLNHIASIEGALLSIFPDGDPLFSEIEVDRLEEQMREHDRRGEVRIYDGAPSRFWREDSPATRLLWHRLETFLEAALTTGEPADFSMIVADGEARQHATM